MGPEGFLELFLAAEAASRGTRPQNLINGGMGLMPDRRLHSGVDSPPESDGLE